MARDQHFEFWPKIRNIRIYFGICPYILELKAILAYAALTKIESDKINNHSVYMLPKLMRVEGVSLDDSI